MSLYIQTAAQLVELAHRLTEAITGDARLALDTEFIRERTYRPVLEILQIAAPENRVIALVDVPAVGDLAPLLPLLQNPEVLKILHAGSQDIEILTQHLGAPPAPVFDTQIAAAFTGHGLQIGYGPLVQTLLGVRLSKEEGFSDWSRRPLPPALLDYAANDVRYLHALHRRLATQLEQRERTSWAQEQTERVLGSAATVAPPEDLWRKVGGKSGMDRRNLAVLRELALWRDGEAQRRDKPRRSVLKDDFLIELARRQPVSAEAILTLRSAPNNLGERQALALVAVIRTGQEVRPEDRPEMPATLPLDDAGGVLVEILSAVVRARAQQEDIAPALLASSDELRALAAGRHRADVFEQALFQGWRGELIGNVLRAVIEGRLAVRWDPARDQVETASGSGA